MRDRRGVVIGCLGALSLVMVAYWILWFTQRSLVASDSRAFYFDFENAFPVADGLVTVLMILTAWALWTRRDSALLFGLLAAGGGAYLFAMDVLFDLEHGIWTKGAGGVIELGINLVTAAATVALTTWLWGSRAAFGLGPEGRVPRDG